MGASMSENITGPQNSGPFFVFIGDYGRQIMTRYKRIQSAQTVLHPCSHIRPDINMVDRIVELDNTDTEFEELLIVSSNAGLVVFVFDGFINEDGTLAALLAEVYRNLPLRNFIIAVTPNASINSKTSPYNLVLEMCRVDYDIPAQMLRSFYNVYCGCSRIGNLVCMKADLDHFRYARISRGQVLAAVSFKSFSDPVYLKLKQDTSLTAAHLVATADQNSFLYAIIEMPINIANPLQTMEKIEFELSGGMVDLFCSLPHPSRSATGFRITLLKLV